MTLKWAMKNEKKNNNKNIEDGWKQSIWNAMAKPPAYGCIKSTIPLWIY